MYCVCRRVFIPAGTWISTDIFRNGSEWPKQIGMVWNSSRGGSRGHLNLFCFPVQYFSVVPAGTEWNQQHWSKLENVALCVSELCVFAIELRLGEVKVRTGLYYIGVSVATWNSAVANVALARFWIAFWIFDLSLKKPVLNLNWICIRRWAHSGFVCLGLKPILCKLTPMFFKLFFFFFNHVL